MQIDLLAAQDDFVFSTNPFPAIIGGLGSGKTQGGIHRVTRLMMDELPGVNYGYYLPTYDLIKLRAMPGFEEILTQLNMPYKLNKSDYTISVEGYGDIIFRSYERPERIIAFETGHAIVDELDTLKKDDAALVWRKVSERNRQKTAIPNSIGCVTTPDMGYNGFIYHNWYKLQRAGYEVIKASTYDNTFLPKEYTQNILDNYDPILADLYLRGEIVSLNQNKVYHFFDRKKHHTDRVLTNEDKFIHISIDFNIGGCTSGVHIIESGYPITVDEFVSYDTRDFINNLSRFKNHKITVYPDASGSARSTNAAQSDIRMILDAGYDVDAPNINPFVRDRINSFNSLLAHDRYRINTNKCPNITNALEVQGYDKKGDPEKFDSHPAVDDWNDNVGYFINRRWGVNREMLSTSSFHMR